MTSPEPPYPPIVKRLAIIRALGGTALVVGGWFGGTGVRERAIVCGLGLFLLATGLLTLHELKNRRASSSMKGNIQRRED